MGLKALKQKKWFKIAANTYVLVLTLFTIWMAFFDTNSLLLHYELKQEVKKLQEQAEYFKKESEKDKKEIEKLSTLEGKEKYAREQYHMKKDNEEVFLIEHEDSLNTKHKD